MDTTTLRRKDTTKGPPLRILSLGKSSPRGHAYLSSLITDLWQMEGG